MIVPLEFLALRVVHTEPPTIPQLQLRFSVLGTGSPGSLGLYISAPLCGDSLNLPVFPILGTIVCPVFYPQMEPRRAVDFSVCLVFYLLGWSGSFLAPYMYNWKLFEQSNLI